MLSPAFRRMGILLKEKTGAPILVGATGAVKITWAMIFRSLIHPFQLETHQPVRAHLFHQSPVSFECLSAQDHVHVVHSVQPHQSVLWWDDLAAAQVQPEWFKKDCF